MRVNKEFKVGPSFIVDAKISCQNVQSGWSLYFGANSGESFQTGFGFYGKSGYIFDSQDNFFGGYSHLDSFNIKSHVFSGARASYFFQNSLINNDLEIKAPIDTIEFQNSGESFLYLSVFHEEALESRRLLYGEIEILYNGDNILF